MKKLAAITFIFLCLNLNAQKVTFGFRGGVSLANLYDHNSDGNPIPIGSVAPFSNPNPPVPQEYVKYQTGFFSDLRPGLLLELFIDLKINERWKLKTGLGYVQKGIDLSYSGSSIITNPDNSTTKDSYQHFRDFRLDYLAVPITFQYYLQTKSRFYILFGEYNACAIDFKIKNATSIKTREIYRYQGQPLISVSISTINEEYASRFDVGLISGCGYEISLNSKWLIGLELNGLVGLINLSNNSSQFLNFDKDSKNISLETSIKITRKRSSKP